ncbi:MAG: hypothetical protein BWZ10_03205 [candidate division BRC1 bacterium ADurb.BinA364]|nr:MAG: hypothetical protein BWZ10_03205 [candidate division BRC1 bacterium ADurb.BinA364]
MLILGSSTIKRWPQTIHADLEPLSLLVRGFGGSTMNDALHFAERIAIRHKPRAVVVYEGDNDIAQGLRAETVLRSFLALAERIHRALPDTRIYAISIKPSLKRWALWPEIRRANALIAHACAQDERMEYLDMVPPMLDAAGRPRPELFVQDGLHLSVEGYALWAQLLRGTLVESERPYENAAGAGLARR